jgi:formylglycine-generating enzyme required for sulfatase activity
MIEIPGGVVRVGSDTHYPEERPAQDRTIKPFRLAPTLVTNRDFDAFVSATGWRTTAEQGPKPGSMVFRMTAGPVGLNDPSQWWRFVDDAHWRCPEGPQSTISERLDHPVVHLSFDDAQAYAQWRGQRLPDEWEWEAAARGGLHGQEFCWGGQFAPTGELMANIWTGAFPWYFARGTAPGTMAVASFPPNGFGLFDMAGNVWEWTTSRFEKSCTCIPDNDGAHDDRLAVRGGSYLCAAEYCLRYRPAARIGVSPTTTTSHIGFRCAE